MRYTGKSLSQAREKKRSEYKANRGVAGPMTPAVMPMPTNEQRATARVITPMPVAAVPFSPPPAQYTPQPQSFTPVPVNQTYV